MSHFCATRSPHFYPATLLLIFAAIATPLSGCTFSSTTAEIRKQPHRNWFNATIYLQGTVGDRAPLLSGQVYQLKDGTGDVWVLSDHKTLTSGKQVRIKGQVYFEKILVEGIDLGEVYIKELEQLPLEKK